MDTKDEGHLTLRKIHEIVGNLADLLNGTFGPDGKAVMISIHSPRQTLVTKVIYWSIFSIFCHTRKRGLLLARSRAERKCPFPKPSPFLPLLLQNEHTKLLQSEENVGQNEKLSF